MPDEIKDKSIHDLADMVMLQAGIVAGDRVPAEKVKALLEALGNHVRPKMRRAETIWVDGGVAVRNGMPFVILSTPDGPMVQLDIVQTRQVAMDLLQMAARTEADAMLRLFFQRHEFPEQALLALMGEFREFRKELDSQPVERAREQPIT